MQALLTNVLDFQKMRLGSLLVTDKRMTIRERLKEKRTDLGKNQGDIGKALGYEQGSISLFERDTARLRRKGVSFARNLFKAYGFDENEASQLVYELFKDELSTLKGTAQLAVRAKGPTVQYAGIVSAGRLGNSFTEDEVTEVMVPEWIAERYDLSKVYAVDVEGDSMVSEDAKESIPEGSRVFFLSINGVRPNNGEIVSCYLEHEDINVIKIWRKEDDWITLHSYNRQHKPIILEESTPCRLQGVYLTHIPRGPRLR